MMGQLTCSAEALNPLFSGLYRAQVGFESLSYADTRTYDAGSARRRPPRPNGSARTLTHDIPLVRRPL
jgi:hypothetical protein